MQPPTAKQPFNRKLRAYGHTAPPLGPMRHHHHASHFVWQQRIGVFLTLLIFAATAYGVTRDVARTLWFLGTLVAVIAVLSQLKRRRPRRLRNLARTIP